MHETTETIADIVREIREASKASIDSGIATCDADERSVGEELLDYADRIEAAVSAIDELAADSDAILNALGDIDALCDEATEENWQATIDNIRKIAALWWKK